MLQITQEQPRRSLRCPVCLARDIDVVLFEDAGGYYCIKCSYTGTEQEIRAAYDQIRKKFRWIARRTSP